MCGGPIDYSLPYRDRLTGVINMWAFTGDHLVPIDGGGSDTYENCGAAHRVCNIRRKATPLEPIVVHNEHGEDF